MCLVWLSVEMERLIRVTFITAHTVSVLSDAH